MKGDTRTDVEASQQQVSQCSATKKVIWIQVCSIIGHKNQQVACAPPGNSYHHTIAIIKAMFSVAQTYGDPNSIRHRICKEQKGSTEVNAKNEGQ